MDKKYCDGLDCAKWYGRWIMEIITIVSEYIMGAINIVIYILLFIIGVLLSFAVCIIFISWIIEIIRMIRDMLGNGGEQWLTN